MWHSEERAKPELVARLRPSCDDGRGVGVGETFDHAHAELDGEAAVVLGCLQRAIPA
jgi:hypothetical protein